MFHSLFTQAELFVPLAGLVLLGFWILCATVVRLHKQASDARLKESMLDRGLSAHEIHTILSAGSEQTPPVPGKPAKIS